MLKTVFQWNPCIGVKICEILKKKSHGRVYEMGEMWKYCFVWISEIYTVPTKDLDVSYFKDMKILLFIKDIMNIIIKYNN